MKNMTAARRVHKAMGKGGSSVSDMFAVDQRVVVVKFWCCRILVRLFGVSTSIR